MLEGDPHSVLEGMAIAGYAIGANHGYIYVRAEYPIAVRAGAGGHRAGPGLRAAGQKHVRQRLHFRHRGADGRRRVRLRRRDRADGLHRRQARHAAVRNRRSRPSAGYGATNGHQQRGDAGQRPPIILQRAPWFAAHRHGEKQRHQGLRPGRQGRSTPGSSRCRWASTLREIIYEIGGGIPDGKTFKAVQTGGPPAAACRRASGPAGRLRYAAAARGR